MSGATPSARFGHTAVWTGSEMLIWGGFSGVDSSTEARFNPAANAWLPMSGADVRRNHTAVWTGTQMIVWGGQNGAGEVLNDGRAYDPILNSWTVISAAKAPTGRRYHTAVWTGTEMIVWGGFNGDYLNDGGGYDPAANTWRALPTTGAPASR